MRWQYASFALGILMCLIAAVLMVEGSILGERTTGIATLILIVGLCIIITSGVSKPLLKPKKS